MDLLIPLPPEIETKSAGTGNCRGKVSQRVSLHCREVDRRSRCIGHDLLNNWLEAFREFTADSPSGCVDVDVSRDSLYERRRARD